MHFFGRSCESETDLVSELKTMKMDDISSLEEFMNEHGGADKLCTFIDKQLGDNAQSIKDRLVNILQSIFQNGSEDFTEKKIHKDKEPFNVVNIMTSFIVNLLNFGEDTFSDWIDQTESDVSFSNYVINFLKHITNPTFITIATSKNNADGTIQEYALPSDAIIPDTLYVTGSDDTTFNPSDGHVCTLDVLETENKVAWHDRARLYQSFLFKRTLALVFHHTYSPSRCDATVGPHRTCP